MGLRPRLPWWEPGNRVRFHSNIGWEYILGVGTGPFQTLVTVLKHLSTDNNSETTFIVAPGEKAGSIKLKWGRDPTMYLCTVSSRQQLMLSNNPVQTDPITYPHNGSACLFRADFIKSAGWFAINDEPKYTVIDLAAGLTELNTPIYSWPWNGGDNQLWGPEVL